MLTWLFGEGHEEVPANLPMKAQLCLIPVLDDFLALHNAGRAPARNVRVDPQRSNIGIVNRVDEPFDIGPGKSWTFLIEDLGPWTEDSWQITVTWEDQQEPLCIPLPTAGL